MGTVTTVMVTWPYDDDSVGAADVGAERVMYYFDTFFEHVAKDKNDHCFTLAESFSGVGYNPFCWAGVHCAVRASKGFSANQFLLHALRYPWEKPDSTFITITDDCAEVVESHSVTTWGTSETGHSGRYSPDGAPIIPADLSTLQWPEPMITYVFAAEVVQDGKEVGYPALTKTIPASLSLIYYRDENLVQWTQELLPNATAVLGIRMVSVTQDPPLEFYEY